MGYRTTRQADSDLIAIYVEGVRNFGVDQAEHYHQQLVAAFTLLAEHPGLARERTELSPPVRLHPCRSHLIVYAEQADGILVIRVLHGRQDWEQHL